LNDPISIITISSPAVMSDHMPSADGLSQENDSAPSSSSSVQSDSLQTQPAVTQAAVVTQPAVTQPAAVAQPTGARMRGSMRLEADSITTSESDSIISMSRQISAMAKEVESLKVISMS
jgi:hypothetical protein